MTALLMTACVDDPTVVAPPAIPSPNHTAVAGVAGPTPAEPRSTLATPTGEPPPPTAAATEAAGTAEPTVLGTFDVALAPEVSGIAAGRRNPDLLWLVDDGPDTTSVVAVRHDGATVTRVAMDGVAGRDTEDLATGPCGPDDPSPCLYVGDIGDNLAARDRVLIHRLPEPAADASSPDVTTSTVTTVAYTLPGGAVDVEALLVDETGLPVLVTKEEGVARVLAATAFADGPLVETGRLSLPRPARPLLTDVVGLSVTAADLAPSGTGVAGSDAEHPRVLLRTYDSVLELTAPTADSPLTGLADWPVGELPAPLEPQGEAIAYLPDGRSYVTASEGSGTLWVVRR